MSNADRPPRRSDIRNSLIIGEATVLLSLPTLQNLGVIGLIGSHGPVASIAALLIWAAFIPSLFMAGLYILERIPIMSPEFRYQLGRYGIIGLFNTFLNAAVFNAFIYVTDISSGAEVVGFSIISFLIVVTQAFFWNKHWTFKGGAAGDSRREYVKFFAVSAVAALVNLVLIHIIVNVIGAPARIDPKVWANIALAFTIVVSVIGNFFGYRLFVFTDKDVDVGRDLMAVRKDAE